MKVLLNSIYLRRNVPMDRRVTFDVPKENDKKGDDKNPKPLSSSSIEFNEFVLEKNTVININDDMTNYSISSKLTNDMKSSNSRIITISDIDGCKLQLLVNSPEIYVTFVSIAVSPTDSNEKFYKFFELVVNKDDYSKEFNNFLRSVEIHNAFKADNIKCIGVEINYLSSEANIRSITEYIDLSKIQDSSYTHISPNLQIDGKDIISVFIYLTDVSDKPILLSEFKVNVPSGYQLDMPKIYFDFNGKPVTHDLFGEQYGDLIYDFEHNSMRFYCSKDDFIQLN
jgi:hypothetical protein